MTVIHAGTLIAEPGKAPLRNASVIVRGQQDRSGAAGLRQRRGRAHRRPAHQHRDAGLHRQPCAHQRPRRPDAGADGGASRDIEDNAYTALGNGKKLLLAGFTTVRDLNGNPRLLRALREAIARGELVGPTILMAGRTVGVTAGHGSGVPGLNRDLTQIAMEQATGQCDGPDSCRRAVRLQVGAGADVIKIAASGGVLSDVAGGLGKQMTDEEMRAVVETARSFGRKVAAHAHGVDGVNAALRAGVHSIEHGTFTNDETFRLYKQTGAYYVPTLIAPVYALRNGERGALRPNQLAKARQAAGSAEKSLRAGRPRRRQHRLRHRQRRQPARDQRRGIRADGARRHDADGGDQIGDGRRRRPARPKRFDRHDRTRQGRRHRRRRRRSAGEHPRAGETSIS